MSVTDAWTGFGEGFGCHPDFCGSWDSLGYGIAGTEVPASVPAQEGCGRASGSLFFLRRRLPCSSISSEPYVRHGTGLASLECSTGFGGAGTLVYIKPGSGIERHDVRQLCRRKVVECLCTGTMSVHCIVPPAPSSLGKGDARLFVQVFEGATHAGAQGCRAAEDSCLVCLCPRLCCALVFMRYPLAGGQRHCRRIWQTGTSLRAFGGMCL